MGWYLAIEVPGLAAEAAFAGWPKAGVVVLPKRPVVVGAVCPNVPKLVLVEAAGWPNNEVVVCVEVAPNVPIPVGLTADPKAEVAAGCPNNELELP